MRIGMMLVVVGAVASAVLAQATGPAARSGAGVGSAGSPQATTRPAEGAGPRALPADAILNQMLKPSGQAERPLRPVEEAPAIDRTSGAGAVAPAVPAVSVMREGTTIVDRVGRLKRGGEAGVMELTFEADGRALRDPPMILLPNLQRESMENMVKSASRDLRFRVTGTVTEYRGRNYLLVEKVISVPEAVQQVP